MSLCLRRWKEQGQWARWSLAKGQHVDVRSGNGYALMCAPAMFKFDQYHRAIGESSHGCCSSGRTTFVFNCSCSCTVVCLIVARQALPLCVAAAQYQQRWQRPLIFTARCVIILDPSSNSEYLEHPRDH